MSTFGKGGTKTFQKSGAKTFQKSGAKSYRDLGSFGSKQTKMEIGESPPFPKVKKN